MRFSCYISLLFIACVIFGCHRSNATRFSGFLPVEGHVDVVITQLITGKEVYRDSLNPAKFGFELKDLQQGVYVVDFMWDRTVIRPSEVKAQETYASDGSPKFVLSKAIWIDRTGQHTIRFLLPDSLDQNNLEGALVQGDSHVELQVDASGEHAKTFEEFLRIGAMHYQYNQYEKDSVKTLFYEANTAGNLQESKRLNAVLAETWLTERKKVMVAEETHFLLNHRDHPMLPYVLYGRVSSQEEFDNYRPVFDALRPKVKDKVSNWFTRYLQKS